MGKKNYIRKSHVFEERYRINDADDMARMNQEIIELTRSNARLSVMVGSRFSILHVYCKTNKSKVYRLCRELLFEEV